LTWWVTAESNRARAKAQALQTLSVTRLGVTREVGCRPWRCTRLNAAYETAWIPSRSACDRNGAEILASAAPAYVRPGANGGEPRSRTPIPKERRFSRPLADHPAWTLQLGCPCATRTRDLRLRTTALISS